MPRADTIGFTKVVNSCVFGLGVAMVLYSERKQCVGGREIGIYGRSGIAKVPCAKFPA